MKSEKPLRLAEHRSSQLIKPGAVWNGAGTWNQIGPNPFDVYVTKTITVDARGGNPEPNKMRLRDGSWINEDGLGNPGISEALPRLRDLADQKPVVVSCRGNTEEGWATLVEAIDAEENIAGIELNVSCPNLYAGFESLHPYFDLTVNAARRLTDKPLIVKLPPRKNLTMALSDAKDAVFNGADALTISNSLPLEQGGALSGNKLWFIVLPQVFVIAERVAAPIIALGGIKESGRAKQYLDAGATCIAIGSANFEDPYTADRVRKGLKNFSGSP